MPTFLKDLLQDVSIKLESPSYTYTIIPKDLILAATKNSIISGQPSFSATASGLLKLSVDELIKMFMNDFPGIKVISKYDHYKKMFCIVSGEFENKYIIITIGDDDYEEYEDAPEDTASKKIVNVLSNDEEAVKVIISKFKSFITKDNPSNIYAIQTDHGTLEMKSIGAFPDKLIQENYDPKVITDFEHVVSDCDEVSPCGRLTILYGIPGSGKTTLIKGITNSATKCKFAVLPPYLVDELTSPSMMKFLLDESENNLKNHVSMCLIIEDADSILVPRAADNINKISSLLNLSDGILGHKLNLRFIVSTNAKEVEIDKALTRAGRICRVMEVGELKREQANDVYSRLVEQKVVYTGDSCVLADIYAAARGTKNKEKVPVTELTKRRAGFGV